MPARATIVDQELGSCNYGRGGEKKHYNANNLTANT